MNINSKQIELTLVCVALSLVGMGMLVATWGVRNVIIGGIMDNINYVITTAMDWPFGTAWTLVMSGFVLFIIFGIAVGEPH